MIKLGVSRPSEKPLVALVLKLGVMAAIIESRHAQVCHADFGGRVQKGDAGAQG